MKEQIEDKYSWLKDKNWQKAISKPELFEEKITNFINSHNILSDQYMSDTVELQEKLYKEFKERFEKDYISPGFEEDGCFYFVKHYLDKEYPLYCMSQSCDRKNYEVVLDLNKKSKNRKYHKVLNVKYSYNKDYISYAVDVRGAENYSIIIKDINNKRLLDYKIRKTNGSYVWSDNNEFLYYVARNTSHRSSKIMQHKVGDDPKNDRIIFEEKDPAFFLEIEETESGKYILIYSNDESAWEVYFFGSDEINPKPKLIKKRKKGEIYELSDHQEDFFILTNKDKAKNFKVMKTKISSWKAENWKEIIPHRKDRLIREIISFKNHLVCKELYKGLPRINVKNLTTEEEHIINFEKVNYDLQFNYNLDPDSNNLFFTYSSFFTKNRTYCYDLDKKTKKIVFENVAKLSLPRENYVVKRVFAPSHDGKKIPIILFYKKDTKLDGKAPLFVSVYGAYGHSVENSFADWDIISLVERGFIYALALVRGSKTKGVEWHEQAKFIRKKNSFKDFKSCLDYLIQNNYTCKGNISAYAMSAGGLIVGYAANNFPEYFKAIIADVPAFDLLNSICDPKLPLTPIEWREWGNPLKNKNIYDYIKSYSPYENIKKQKYPNMLVIGAINDTRVTYWEPAKWIAKLKDHKTDNNVQLLYTHQNEGHLGPSGSLQAMRDTAFKFAFILKVHSMTT